MAEESARRLNQAIRVAVIAWAIIGIAIVAAAVLWFLDRISGALAPFLMAGIIVLILRTPVRALQRRGVSRALAVGFCYLIGFVVLALLGAFVVPVMVAQIQDFLQDFPRYYRQVEAFWFDMQDQFSGVLVPDWARDALRDISATVARQFGVWSQSAASGLVSAGGAAAAFAFNIVFSLVIAFWALRDLPGMRAEMMTFVGERRRAEAEMIIATVFHVLGGYIRGQLIVSAITGLGVAIGLAILQVPYAAVLGLIAGVLNVVPYIGPFVAGLIAAIVGAFVGPWTALGAIGVTIGVQQATDILVTPRVMSEQVDLHPLLVIFSLLVGGTLFGFWGLVLAIPVAAIIKGLFVYYYEKHTQRPLSTESGALFRSKTSRSDSEGACPPVADETAEPTAEERAT